MKTFVARLAALVLIIGAVAPAAAQLLPPLPGGSLIVTLTSPSGGSTVSGTIPVSASVSIVGTLTVSRVEFFRNGNFIGSDSGAPYSVSWNTTTVSNGSHTLSAVAVDVLGVRWTSNSVTVNVSNGPPPDTSAPNVSITSPGNGATVSGTINVTAGASDDVGVTGVRFLLDGVVRADDTSSPYSISWNTATASNGSHTLTAVARDAAGNTRTSAPVTVTVANDTTRPTVTINQSVGQADPTSASPINFTVVFSEPVSGFAGSDVVISGTAGATTAAVSGGPSTYTVAVSGMTSSGTVIASIGAGVAQDAAGNTNTASTSADNSVTFNSTLPALTIASFSPVSGPVGTVVTITGNNFIGATGVAFNGVPATTASLDSNTQITATVPSGATTGPISVTTPVGTATSGTSFTVDSATPGVTRSEESAASVAGTGWVLRGSEIAAFSGGTAGSSDVGGDTASFTFSGTAVSWIGLKCNICGIATVSIDGGAPISVDTAGATAVGSPGLASEVVFTSPTLEAGTHTLVITMTGNTASGGAHVVVDAFDVTGGTGSNTTRIEQDDAAVVSYAGTWVRDEANTAASGGTFSESNAAGATLTLSFTGTEVRWLGYRFAGGGIARISVDGTFMGEVNTYASSPALGVVFTAAGLSAGTHTLTIEVTGARGDPAAFDSWVIVDAFDVVTP